MRHPKSRLVTAAAVTGTVCALAAAGAASASTVWSKSAPAIPNAYTNTTPALSQIALTGKNVIGTFVAWKGQYDNRIHYKYRIAGKWSKSEIIPGADTNTSPSAASYVTLKGKNSEVVAWKQLHGTKIFYAQGVAQSNGVMNWTKVATVPGGKYSATTASPAVLFPFNSDGRLLIAWRGPYDHVRTIVASPSGKNGRSFYFGKKPTSYWIGPGTKSEPTTTGGTPALTEISTGATSGTVYVFWKGNSTTAPIDYATATDSESTGGLAGNVKWAQQGSVPTGATTVAETTAAPAVSSAGVHGNGPLLLAYKGPSGIFIRYQVLTGTSWTEPYAFVTGSNRQTTDGPALLFGLLANVSPTSNGRIFLHHYTG